MALDNIDWDKIRENLCFERNPTAYKKRSSMWMQIDVNGNGFVSLAEVDKGMRDILRLDEVFLSKPVMMRAFQAAKNACKSKSKYGKDYVERREFRLLLMYLR